MTDPESERCARINRTTLPIHARRDPPPEFSGTQQGLFPRELASHAIPTLGGFNLIAPGGAAESSHEGDCALHTAREHSQ